jgi:hypothetical protein
MATSTGAGPAPPGSEPAASKQAAVPESDATETAPTPARGATRPVKDGAPSPRQPNERDESSDSQQGAPSDLMRKAHDDVERGVADTSRGEATDAAYRRVRAEAGKPGTARPDATQPEATRSAGAGTPERR